MQTPYPWARAMADSFQDAVLLTVDGVGHGAHGGSGECVDGAVDTYLLTGRTPAEGTTCVQQPPASAALSGAAVLTGVSQPYSWKWRGCRWSTEVALEHSAR